MGKIKFVPNRFASEQIMRTEAMRLTMARTAGKVADVARYLAPIEEGDYARKIYVASGFEDGMMIARVNAFDYKSVWIEFGTEAPGPTPAFSPLRRACDETGLKITGGDR